MTTNETNTLAVALEPAPTNPDATNRGLSFSKRAIAVVAILAACAALAIASGVHSRLKAETKLRTRRLQRFLMWT
jgi:anti-sigma factor RsiW